jgi:hypothetical protein
MKLNMWKTAIIGTLMLVMAVLEPALVSAAAPEFTALQKFDFDKTVAGADGQMADKLTGQYRDYLSLTERSRSWEEKTGALHYRNEDQAASVRKRITQIDSAKINSLKLSVEQAKKRYQPLFDMYTAVNAQLAAARKLKSKALSSVLSTQSERLKLPVQLAHADIKGRQIALNAARDSASALMKKVRTTLSGIDPLKTQYKSAKESLSALRDSRSLAWKNLTQAVKKRDAKTASDRLSSVNSLSLQQLEKLQQMFALETRVADVIAKAEVQMSQSK